MRVIIMSIETITETAVAAAEGLWLNEMLLLLLLIRSIFAEFHECRYLVLKP